MMGYGGRVECVETVWCVAVPQPPFLNPFPWPLCCPICLLFVLGFPEPLVLNYPIHPTKASLGIWLSPLRVSGSCAHSLKEQKNLNSFFAVMFGLSNSAISRLAHTWEVSARDLPRPVLCPPEGYQGGSLVPAMAPHLSYLRSVCPIKYGSCTRPWKGCW